MEQWALSQVGRTLYNALIRDYTRKQWGREPRELSASILKRLPIRFTWDDNYFDDTYQGIPIGGYTQIFERLLEGCDVRLGVDYLKDRGELGAMASHIVYTGPIDAFYDHCDGILEYRTLSFRTETLDVPDFQGCAQVNYTGNNVPWTRTIEHKHFDPVDVARTVVTWETPSEWKPGAEPFYPINDAYNARIYNRYRLRAEQETKVSFGGRLGTYKYYDMHQCVAQAMTLAKKEGLVHDP